MESVSILDVDENASWKCQTSNIKVLFAEDMVGRFISHTQVTNGKLNLQ